MNRWQRVPLERVTAKIGTGSTPKGGARAYREHGTPLVRSMNVHRLRISSEGMAHIGPAQAALLASVELQENDVLMNITGTGTIGRTAMVTPDLVGARVNQHVCIIRSNGAILPEFLAYYLNSPVVQEWIRRENYGSTREALTKALLSKLEVPVPPLGEQRRIAEKLDQMMQALARVKSKITAAQERLELYKSMALERAFVGDWPVVEAGTLFEEGPTNGYSPKSSSNGTGPLTLKLSATTAGTLKLTPETTKRLSRPILPTAKYWLRDGDTLIQRANVIQYVGATAIFSGPNDTYIYPDLMMRVRIADKVTREFFWRYMNSSAARNWLRKRASGTSGSMPKITGATLKRLPIPMPPPLERKAIVERIDELFRFCDNKLRDAEYFLQTVINLEYATLERAFRGDFVAPDQNDEPAIIPLVTTDKSAKMNPSAPRPSMKKISGDKLLSAIDGATSGAIDFDEIRTAIDLEYEAVKDVVFTAINTGTIEQFFDKEAQRIRFRRGGRK